MWYNYVVVRFFFHYYCNNDYFSANNITDVNIFRNYRLFYFGIVIITLLRVISYIILLVIVEKKTALQVFFVLQRMEF